MGVGRGGWEGGGWFGEGTLPRVWGGGEGEVGEAILPGTHSS